MFVHSLNVFLKWGSTIWSFFEYLFEVGFHNISVEWDSNVCSFFECHFEEGFQCLFIL